MIVFVFSKHFFIIIMAEYIWQIPLPCLNYSLRCFPLQKEIPHDAMWYEITYCFL